MLLVGGGTEDYGDWSDLPYGWAVEQADSGRVLIIGHSPASNWLPDYFMDLGASYARNLTVASFSDANAPWMADTVAAYDLIFFRGGDQWAYIDAFLGSALQAAVLGHWTAGKAVGGTSAGCAILSGWMFSAESGTVYPDEVLEDPFNTYMAFEPGLWAFQQDWIFDTHYTERGRQGRLPGFLAHLESTVAPRGLPFGLGVDDRTALCISPAGEGLVMGSGTVSSLQLSGNGLVTPGAALHLDSVLVGQARHGDRIRMSDGRVLRSGIPMDLRAVRQRTEAEVFLGGSGGPGANGALLEAFARPAGEPRTRILVLGEGPLPPLNAWANALLAKGVSSVDIAAPDPADPGLEALLVGADAVLVVHNSTASLDAMRSGPNGLLADSLFRNGMASAWVGANARHAGAVVVEGYDAPLAAYTGSMRRSPGWALLDQTVVLPEAYQDADRQENTASGISWAMVAEALRHGVLLDQDACARFHPTAEGYRLQTLGNFPTQFWSLDSTRVDTVIALLDGASAPRQMGAFAQASLQILKDTSLLLAYRLPDPSSVLEPEHPAGPRLDPLPSPLGDAFYWPYTDAGTLHLVDVQGRTVFRSRTGNAPLHAATDAWPEGLMLLYWLPDGAQHVRPSTAPAARPFVQRLLLLRPR